MLSMHAVIEVTTLNMLNKLQEQYLLVQRPQLASSWQTKKKSGW